MTLIKENRDINIHKSKKASEKSNLKPKFSKIKNLKTCSQQKSPKTVAKKNKENQNGNSWIKSKADIRKLYDKNVK